MKIFKFALFVSLCTFLLLIIGGVVNPTGSSLACPDWPTCFGSFFPEMKNGVEIEHTHRVAASLVGLLTFTLAFLTFRSTTTSQHLKRVTLFASIIVILQGVLGGITVLYRLPLFVSTGHLSLAMIFFSTTIYIAFRAFQERNGMQEFQENRSVVKAANPVRIWALVAVIGVYLQIVLGAFVRHTQSGRACGTDIPMCGGEWWPSLHPQQLHMAHRIFGIVLFFVIVAAAMQIRLQARRLKNMFVFRLSRFIPAIVTLQVLLGVITVTSFVGLVQVTAHLAVGALLMAVLWMAYFGLLLPTPYLLGSKNLKSSASDSMTIKPVSNIT